MAIYTRTCRRCKKSKEITQFIGTSFQCMDCYREPPAPIIRKQAIPKLHLKETQPFITKNTFHVALILYFGGKILDIIKYRKSVDWVFSAETGELFTRRLANNPQVDYIKYVTILQEVRSRLRNENKIQLETFSVDGYKVGQ